MKKIPFKRSPVMETTGMIRVGVSYQQDKEDTWVARVHGSGPLHKGRTKAEAIRNALQGASVKPITGKEKKP